MGGDLVSEGTTITFVDHIPDLMTWDDYELAHRRRLVRICLQITDNGLEIIGDSPYPQMLEDLLEALSPEAIEMMLCG